MDSLDVYDLTDGLAEKPATSPAILLNPVFFTGTVKHHSVSILQPLIYVPSSDNRTIATIHAPTSKQWIESAQYPFNSSFEEGDPSKSQ